jgi:hypothetical protein
MNGAPRHFVAIARTGKHPVHYWIASPSARKLGFMTRRLPPDLGEALAAAERHNAELDNEREREKTPPSPIMRKNPWRPTLPDCELIEITRKFKRNNARPILCRVTETGCHECVSHRPNKHGYIQIYADSADVLLHRYVYASVHGPIPDGHEVHHRCVNPSCARLDHLELVPAVDHARLHAETRKATQEQVRGPNGRWAGGLRPVRK